MKRIAIVYSSQSGQTDRIAEFMARYLSCFGHVVSTFNLLTGTAPTELALGGFDHVLIGGPVYYGEFDEQLIDWASENSDRLNRATLGVFSVSVNAASRSAKCRHKASSYTGKFVDQAALRPDSVAHLGGAARYSRIGAFAKLALRIFCSKAGLGSASYQDRDLTDWKQIEKFLCGFLKCDVPEKSIMLALAGAPTAVDANVPYAA